MPDDVNVSRIGTIHFRKQCKRNIQPKVSTSGITSRKIHNLYKPFLDSVTGLSTDCYGDLPDTLKIKQNDMIFLCFVDRAS
jgi:hypothetical protein